MFSARLQLRLPAFMLAMTGFLTMISAQEAQKSVLSNIEDKTLVAWVYLDNTEQRGGSALTLDNQDDRFDGIVFGEIEAGRWMSGSDAFRRSQREQSAIPAETADSKTPIQMAIVYHGNRITIYRDGVLYNEYQIEKPQKFGQNCVAVMGLRHLTASDRACLAGAVEDARIYNIALSADQMSKLEANKPSDPMPMAWWSFENGEAGDRMGVFSESLLIGNARIDRGRLHWDGKNSWMAAIPSWQADRWLALSGQGSKNNERISAVRRHRTGLLDDMHRPAYHFVTPEGYCMPFDPNGAIYWKGKYHLCYIFQDERGHCWGHASSADLVHWRIHPPALFPAPGDPDRGIFSGNAFVNKEGAATILYHGVDAGNCIATSSETELDNWIKLPTNPIIPSPKKGDPDFGKYQSWDPHGWLEGDTYYAIFGGNPATLFKATDINDWGFVHKFVDADLPGVDSDEDISCPDFFPLGNTHMLLCISHKRGCRYYLGRWENETFYPETHARMNWPGGTFFAPESLIDDQGRRIMWAWVLDRRTEDVIRETGWSGTMSLPRVLSLAEDGTLLIEPVEELSQLRMDHQRCENIRLEADTELVLDDIRGDCMEMILTMWPNGARRFGVKVRCSPDGEEQTVIEYDPGAKRLRVDFSNSTLDTNIAHRTFCMYGGENPQVTLQEAPFELKPDEPLELRIFLDRSILEVFANGRQCITQRIYPTRKDSQRVILFSDGGSVNVDSVDAWKMAPANPW